MNPPRAIVPSPDSPTPSGDAPRVTDDASIASPETSGMTWCIRARGCVLRTRAVRRWWRWRRWRWWRSTFRSVPFAIDVPFRFVPFRFVPFRSVSCFSCFLFLVSCFLFLGSRYYIDNGLSERGPFPNRQMRLWYQHGTYLQPNLLIRRSSEARASSHDVAHQDRSLLHHDQGTGSCCPEPAPPAAPPELPPAVASVADQRAMAYCKLQVVRRRHSRATHLVICHLPSSREHTTLAAAVVARPSAARSKPRRVGETSVRL